MSKEELPSIEDLYNENLPSVEDFVEDSNLPSTESIVDNKNLPSIKEIEKEPDLPSVEDYIEEETITIEDAEGNTFAEVEDIIPPWPELLKIINDVREEIPNIPEIKYYDAELEKICEIVDEVRSEIPEVKYYDVEVEAICEQIDLVRDTISELPEVKYYDEQIDLIENRINVIKEDIHNLPEPKYYDNDIQSIREDIEVVKKNFPWIEANFKGIGENLENVNDSIGTVEEKITLELDSILETVDVKVFENKVLINEVKDNFVEDKQQILADIKESSQKIFALHNEFKDDDKKLKKQIKGEYNKLKQSIQEQLEKYNQESVKTDELLLNYFTNLKEEIGKLPEVKSYDSEIKSLKTSIKESTRKFSPIESDIKSIYKIVEDIKKTQIKLNEQIANEPPDVSQDIKSEKDPLISGDQKFATLDDLSKHYKLFVTRIQQQLSTIGGGGEVRLEFLDDVDRNTAKVNGKFLRYDSSVGKWVGANASGGAGSQTLDETLGLDNTSSLGMSVGVATATKLHIDPVGSGFTYSEDLVVQGNARVTGILSIGTSSIVLDATNNELRGVQKIRIDSAEPNVKPIVIKQLTEKIVFIKTEERNGEEVETEEEVSVGIGTTVSINTSGIITASSFVGDGSGLTNLPSGGVGIGTTGSINTSGIITASSFVGDGVNLTGVVTSIVAGSNVTISGSTGRVTINASGGGGGGGSSQTLDQVLTEGNTSSLGMSVGVVTATSFDGTSTFANSAGIATYATNAGIASYADVAGIATVAENLTGSPSINVTNITGIDATFSGNVSIAGTLTYEDVTNIDAIGLITARSGIEIGFPGAATTLSVDGNAIFSGVITATTFSGNLPTTDLTGTITNAQLDGSIANAKLVNDSVSFGGVSLDLGGTDATPAFNLSDATAYPYTSLTGITTEIVGDTTPQLGGNLDLNSKTITGTGSINVTGIVTATTFSGNLPTTDLTGTITNAQLDGSIANAKLSNSSIAIGGVTLNLGDTDATPAFDLSGATNYSYTNLTGITTSIVGDTTPQLGGNLDLNSKLITGTGGINVTGVVTATTFSGNLPTTDLTGTITNAQLAGSIANAKLANDSVSFGGVSLDLGTSDATPAFDLSDATNYSYTNLTGITTSIVGDTTPQLGGNLDLNSKTITGTGSINVTGIVTATTFRGNLPTTDLTGTITNAQLAGSIANAKLANSSIAIGGVTLNLGDTDATPAFDLSDATNYPTSSLSGTITNAQLAGSIANAKLANSSIAIGGVTLNLGDTDATPAFDLSDATNYSYTNLTGITTSIVGDTTPQLGGNLDLNNNSITGTGNLNISGVSTFSGDVTITSTGNLILDSNGPQKVIFKDSSIDGLELVYYTNGDYLAIQKSSNSNSLLRAYRDEGQIELYYSNAKKLETTGIGISVFNGASDTATIAGPSNLIIDPGVVGDNTGIVRIKGDLFVDGSTTQINSTTVEIADKVIGIATTCTSDLLTDGAGIGIGSDKTFLYEFNSGTNPSLKSSENINVASGKGYQVNQVEVLNATALGSSVVNSSLTSVGTLSALTVGGDVSIADKIVHTGDTSTAIRFPANDTVTVETGGGERVRVTSAGNVGIGTDNPTEKLEVDGTVKATTFSGSGANLTSIPNSALTNDSVSFGGVSLDLGGTDATPAFDLSDATNYPTSSLSGTITNAQLAGSIANTKLANDSVSFGGVSLDLGGTDATPAFDLSDATNYPYTSLIGITTSIIGDTTPQLGGNLDVNNSNITGTGNVNLTGIITATLFSGSGASLTTLNASELDSGTIPDGRFPTTLPAVSGTNLTGLTTSLSELTNDVGFVTFTNNNQLTNGAGYVTANTQLSNEQVQDIVGGMVSSNTESGITVTYEDSDGTLDFSVASQTDENFTTTLKNKLDGIEASATADQTAAEIRTLVESASDSNVFTDADHTKLDGIETGATADQTKADINALGIDADQLDGEEGSYYLNYNNFSNTPTIPTNNNQLTNGAGYVTANTQLSNEQVQDIVGGMVSGNTESGITVTYEDSDGTLDFSVASQTDENFTTTLKNKLDGIEASADVTDATNVNAAGAVMNSDSTTASMSFVIDEDNMSSNSATKVPTQQSVKAYVDSEVSSLVDAAPGALDTLNELASAINDDANFSTTITNSIATKLPLAGGTMTGNIVMSGSETVDGRDLSADGTKLDGIEASEQQQTKLNQTLML